MAGFCCGLWPADYPVVGEFGVGPQKIGGPGVAGVTFPLVCSDNGAGHTLARRGESDPVNAVAYGSFTNGISQVLKVTRLPASQS